MPEELLFVGLSMGGALAELALLTVAPGRGLEAGVRMPYSCTMGGCGACRVKLLEGEVSMENPNCLTAQERAAGEVLACVSRAVGPCVIEVPQ